MPTLTWIGKDKVVNHHQEVPYRVLEHLYGFRGDDVGKHAPSKMAKMLDIPNCNNNDKKEQYDTGTNSVSCRLCENL